MSKRQRVLIFGLSYHGRAVYRLLDRKIYDIVGFIENDIDKIDGKFGDANIYHINNIDHFDFDKVIISGRNIDDMIKQLRDEFNIDWKKILVMERSDLALKRGEEFAKFSDIDICVMSEHIPLSFDVLNKDSGLYDITTDKYHSDSKYWKKGDISWRICTSISNGINWLI